ncbi:SDR family oxidoreductase [Xanthomonas sp. AmX2]|uniref:SDR family NAD(P)-dependent oxidoreductase n=1 Tax=Xanthomonas sp. TaxID=29446 RepID=UPI00197D290E|nr:SDR family NAD(P)-dependent oxidoreductase [Xanthomonas sp.]MBN6151836.1 SDR family oxidoreductase [Xanthomonas sp.]
MNRFNDKVVLVTGGGSGIGLASARRFLDEGARVAIAGRNRQRLEAAAAALPADRVLLVAADVAVRAECDALVAATTQRFGRLDTVVNAAGMNLVGALSDTSDDDWRQCMGADLDSIFYIARAALPHLRASRGSIVNVGSVSSLGGGWSHAAYCAAKAAVANLTRAIACDNGRHGVRANTVCPGLTVTAMVDGIMDDAALLQKAWERIPLRRAAAPEEVAAAIAFLASDEAAYITGIALPVDGGQTCTDGGPEWGK